MDFTGIGKIGTFAKQKNLLFAANYRMKTGQSIVDGSGRLTLTKSTMFSQIQSSSKSSTSVADKTRLASIKQKLKSGKKLSQAEMNYLKEKDPSTYKKAKYADEAREELKEELKQATTKQEARQAVMRAVAKIAADCAADFESLQASAGGGGMSLGGANMNFGGDSAVNMNVEGAATENLNVEGGENISTGEISGVENVDATANENSAVQNENPVAQAPNLQGTDENSDSAADILDKYIYAIRAIQDEWLNFIKSDEYKEMPEDIFEEAEMLLHGGKKSENKIANAQAVDAILAYRAAMNYRLEE